MEIKDTPSEIAVNSAPWLEDTFRVIPWSILSINKELSFPKKMTLNDKWMATFLAYLVRKSKDGTCRPTNQEIDRAMGTPLQKEMGVNPHRRVTDRLTKLELCGLITVTARNGKGRQIIVCQELIQMVNEVGKPGIMALTIRPEVFQLHLSIPKKIVLSAKLRLPSIGAETLSKRLEISKSQAYQHLKDIEKIKIELTRKPESNLPENRNEPTRKPGIGIVGDSYIGNSSLVSKDTIIPPAGRMEENLYFSPIGEDSSKPLENRSKKIPQEELVCCGVAAPVPAAPATSKWDDPKVEADLRREQSHSQPTPKVALPCIEVEKLTKYKNITHHKDRNNKAYKGAVKAIRSLGKGPGTTMDDAQRRRFLKVNQNDKINIDQVKRFLDHPFTKEERESLYKLLDDSRSPAYCAGKNKGVKVPLAVALENPYTGYSILLHLWYHPPKPIQPPLREELQKPIEIIKEAFPDSTGGIQAITGQFFDYYQEVIRPKLDQHGMKNWGFVSCLHDLIDSALEFNKDHPVVGSSIGWLKIGSKTFKNWDEKFWVRIKEEVGRRNWALMKFNDEDEDYAKREAEECREIQEELESDFDFNPCFER